MTFLDNIWTFISSHLGKITAVAGAIAAITVFAKNLLSIIKTWMEIRILREEKRRQPARISVPTQEEVSKYGGRGQWGSGVSILPALLQMILKYLLILIFSIFLRDQAKIMAIGGVLLFSFAWMIRSTHERRSWVPFADFCAFSLVTVAILHFFSGMKESLYLGLFYLFWLLQSYMYIRTFLPRRKEKDKTTAATHQF